MAKLNSILVLLVMSVMVERTSSAAVLNLSNPNPTASVTLQGVAELSEFDSITKSGPGAVIVPISLTNTGSTSIRDGLLQFSGSVVNLQNVNGSTMQVGDGTHSSSLTASSICVNTLALTPGCTLTLRAIPGGPVSGGGRLLTPEPVSWVIWLLVGLTAVLAYRRRR